MRRDSAQAGLRTPATGWRWRWRWRWGWGWGCLLGLLLPAQSLGTDRGADFGTSAQAVDAAATEANGSPGAEPVGTAFYPLLGLSWVLPADTEVRAIYPPGVGFGGGFGFLWNDVRAEARVDWFRRSGTPRSPGYVEAPASQLTLLPISVVGHYLLGEAASRPFVSAGATLWIEEEEFDYQIAGNRRSVDASNRRPGGLVGIGVEARSRFALHRLSLRGILGGGNRRLIRGAGDPVDRNGSVVPSLWTVSYEILFH